MTTYSKSDLATRVLRDLGLIDAGATPSASDLAWAEEAVSAVVSTLNAKGIPVWNGSDESVPEEYLVPLSTRIGLAVGPSFGLFTIAEAASAIESVERELHTLNARQPTGAAMQASYF